MSVQCESWRAAVAIVFVACILAPPNMKLRSLALSFVASAAFVLPVAADPVLPYQQPIADQLTVDINGGSPDTPTLNRALTAFHKTSKNLRGDTQILRNLENYLNDLPTYQPLLTGAANAYQEDFYGRLDELNAQIVPAPISPNKILARTALRRVDSALSNAVNSVSTSQRIRRLQTAALRLASASNSIQRALHTKPGLSKMTARIGVLSFASDRGQIAGSGDFMNNDGSAIGQFSSNGVLSVSAIDQGAVTRGIHLHLDGVTRDTPALYPLGVGNNRAFYDATDLRRREEFHFRASPDQTNSVVTNAFVSIDYIGTNSFSVVTFDTNAAPITNTFFTTGYVLGHFAFVGTNIFNFTSNTNTSVNVSAGEFQLNFEIQSNTNGVPTGSE
jgi:hypothetical protein